MNLNQPSNSPIDEPCNPVGLYPVGFFNDDPPKILVQSPDSYIGRDPITGRTQYPGSTNRLIPLLKEFVRNRVGDPLAFLVESAAFFMGVMSRRHLSREFAEEPDLTRRLARDKIIGTAFADLAVTGRGELNPRRVQP